MQTIIFKQFSTGAFADDMPIIAPSRHCLIKERLGPRYYCRTAFNVITARLRRGRIQRIGAIERIIQASPPRIGSIQRKARVQRRHNQLRSRHRRHFGIHIGGINRERRRLGHQITNFAQKSPIRLLLERVRFVPRIDLRLQIIPLRQQGPVYRRKACQNRRQSVPQMRCIDARPRQNLILDKCCQNRRDFEARTFEIRGHKSSLNSHSAMARLRPFDKHFARG